MKQKVNNDAQNSSLTNYVSTTSLSESKALESLEKSCKQSKNFTSLSENKALKSLKKSPPSGGKESKGITSNEPSENESICALLSSALEEHGNNSEEKFIHEFSNCSYDSGSDEVSMFFYGCCIRSFYSIICRRLHYMSRGTN